MSDPATAAEAADPDPDTPPKQDIPEGEAAAVDPTKRAIILVPGFSRREKSAARDQLVEALEHYAEGYKIEPRDAEEGTDPEAVTLRLTDRAGAFTAKLDVYESFWGDLIPDWSKESPWTRFKRGWHLISYWMTGGLGRSIVYMLKSLNTENLQLASWARTCVGFLIIGSFIWYLAGLSDRLDGYIAAPDAEAGPVRTFLVWLDGLRYWPLVAVVVATFALGYWQSIKTALTSGRQGPVRLPPKTVFALIGAGFGLLLWYLLVVSILLKAMIDPESEPAFLASLPTQLKDWVIEFAKWLDGASFWPFALFVIGIFGKGFLEGMANMSTFVKAYLGDDTIGEDHIGLRAKSRSRLLEVLDQVADADYDEIHVVGHSLGCMIAVDALAEYGSPSDKITLHTWGSMMTLVVIQEPLIEREIAKLYANKTKLANWIDVSFHTDIFSSPRPVVRQLKGRTLTPNLNPEKFPPTMRPPMPWKTLFSKYDTHSAYYRCEDAMLMLAFPAKDLPGPPATGSAFSSVR